MCPQCGIEHEDILSECSCGYSAYKILGIRPEASAEEAKQAYKYLLNVWQTDSSSHDPVSKKKAQERLKKINGAYDIFRNNLPGSSVEPKKSTNTKIAAFVAVVFIILLGVVAFTTNVFRADSPVVRVQRKTAREVFYPHCLRNWKRQRRRPAQLPVKATSHLQCQIWMGR